MLLYVHYPFCRRKCAYCGFFSRQWQADAEEVYFSALLREVSYWGRVLSRPRVDTLYLGGGTPSLLDPRKLETLLERIGDCFSLSAYLELSLEANPDSLSSRELAGELVGLGVTRISLGLQSLDDGQLSLLGRPHTAEQGIKAVEAVRSAGTKHVGLDLLWGLPGQSSRQWLEQLRRAASLGADHISCYCLTLEEGTQLAARIERGELELPPEQELEAMYLQGAKLLQEQGFLHYEIANFALPGAACRHNQGYWQGRKYLGLGPSAVSTLGGKRWANPSDIGQYAEAVLSGGLAGNAASLSPGQQSREMLLLGLRTSQGLDLAEYSRAFGEDLRRSRAEVIRELQKKGLVRMEEGRLWLTSSGMLLCDSVVEALM